MTREQLEQIARRIMALDHSHSLNYKCIKCDTPMIEEVYAAYLAGFRAARTHFSTADDERSDNE